MYEYMHGYNMVEAQEYLIYTKYTCLYYDTYLLCYMCYPKSVNY